MRTAKEIAAKHKELEARLPKIKRQYGQQIVISWMTALEWVLGQQDDL
jgi:hypothetical protein